jgi:predicted GTPase
LDYEDLQGIVAKSDIIDAQLEHISAKEVSDKEKAIAEIFEDIQKGPFDDLRQKALLQAFQAAYNSDFEVNVVATMSSGKSTLINALLGKKLMPAKQEACTAVITRIKDNDKDGYRAEAYDDDGNLIETHEDLTYKVMKRLNENENISTIAVEGDIPFVTADDVSLVLVDTPGPNNSRNINHARATMRMIDNSSKPLVLYILNATQLAVNDDNALLNSVADSMSVKGKQSKDRFIFVVNKMDEYSREDDSVESALEKTRKYLEDKGIYNPTIFPAAALPALDIRTFDEADEFTRGDILQSVRKLNGIEKLHFDEKAPLTPSLKGEISRRLAEAKENGNANEEALVHTGIIGIEIAIKQYVQKYAKTAKIKNIYETFENKLKSAGTMERAKREILENEDKQKAIQKQIKIINDKLKDGESAKAFKDKIKALDFSKDILAITNELRVKAEKRVADQLEGYYMDDEMTENEAKDVVRRFQNYVGKLGAEIGENVSKAIEKHVAKSAESMVNEYKKKLATLLEDVKIDDIVVDPIDILNGSLFDMTNASALIEASKETTTECVGTEKVKVGTKSVKVGTRDDRNFFEKLPIISLFTKHKIQDVYEKEDVYEDKEIYEDRVYISAERLKDKLLAPVQTAVYDTMVMARKQADIEVDNVKNKFLEQFVELDKALKKKMDELAAYNKDNENLDSLIKENNRNIAWLHDINKRVEAILEI